ncbi:HAD-IA family hydrolase [bacterium]|nr:HAD-IA family hydrolase [bacterium]
MKNTKVVYLDLWRTMALSNCREPIWFLQKAIGHKLDDNEPFGVVTDEEFLSFCLTTNLTKPRALAKAAIEKFGGEIDEDAFQQFLRVITQESNCLAQYWDVNFALGAMKEAAIQLGMISNLWAFPTARIFGASDLDSYLNPSMKLLSFEVGIRKPDPEIFRLAIARCGSAASECTMIGDNLHHDCIPAKQAGMNAILIDREQRLKPEDVPSGIYRVENLFEVLDLLDIPRPKNLKLTRAA